MKELAVDAPEETEEHGPICAIGASAGGISALRTLFSELPDDLGLVYVVIVHLSPEHPSALAEILGACTSMPVHQVEDGPQMRRNCVYVIPPDRELVIEDGHVTARPFSQPRGKRAPVDMFFRSVAAAYGDGMAVILSGSGADGSNGVRAVQEAGGVIFAQDPGEAEFSAMPQNAINTGVVSFVAPITELVQQIAEVSRSKHAVRSLDGGGAANGLRRIMAMLRERTGHDFSGYKRATVKRRVLRRMHVCRTTSPSEYFELVSASPEEANALFNDLLISVTQFFRDEAAFETLASSVVRPLFEQVDEAGIRVWSAGCATGEEAYSLAMILIEEAERRKVHVPIQIFASDLDEGALGVAREGRYPRSIVADVSEERLARFFIDEGTHYRVRKELRGIVLFASHSILKDPPFMRLDLIVCRNLLIYLERAPHEHLLSVFHYGLKSEGCLFLGSAETSDARSELFSAIDRDARIYRARPQARRNLPLIPQMPAAAHPARSGRALRGGQRLPAEQHALAIEQVAPPSVLVDDAQQILHLSHSAGRYILHSGGTFSGKLPGVVRPELRLDLKIALDRALANKTATMTHPTPVVFDGATRWVALQVSPVPGRESEGSRALVLFLDAGPAEPESEPADAGANLIPKLELAALRATQEELGESRAEHEEAIEDLRAANEELQSINEEYRSTSEELETSREELQSMNEELQTVNAELKTKFENISTAHNDLKNLISSTEIGTLFLDANLRIRMFTPSVAELFNISERDIGRAITDLTHRLRRDGIETEARRVLRDFVSVESEVEGSDGRWFLMGVRPYRTIEDRIEGVVLTFVDISSRRETERQLEEGRRRYETLFRSIDEGFCVIELIRDDTGRVVDYRFVDQNAAFERQTGLRDATGKTARELIPDLEDEWCHIFEKIARTREPARFEAPARGLDRFYEAYAFPVDAHDGLRLGMRFRDISERKQAEEQREMLTRELSHRVKNSLAVVQALARQAGAPGATLEQYRHAFLGRIQALARAHDQLLETKWQSADLGALIRATLEPYRSDVRSVTIEGPALLLSPSQGLGLALIVHELATNGAKYGALSADGGDLSVRWTIRGGNTSGVETVHLRWQERNGPHVADIAEKGFGTRLIERASAYELGGSASMQFASDGLIVDLAFPKVGGARP